MLKILAYKVNKNPEVIEVENKLEALKEVVEGYIQFVPLANGNGLLCNEEGMLLNLPYQKQYRMYGNFLIVGVDEESSEFCSLSEDEIEYTKNNIQYLLSFVMRI